MPYCFVHLRNSLRWGYAENRADVLLSSQQGGYEMRQRNKGKHHHHQSNHYQGAPEINPGDTVVYTTPEGTTKICGVQNVNRGGGVQLPATYTRDFPVWVSPDQVKEVIPRAAWWGGTPVMA